MKEESYSMTIYFDELNNSSVDNSWATGLDLSALSFALLVIALLVIILLVICVTWLVNSIQDTDKQTGTHGRNYLQRKLEKALTARKPFFLIAVKLQDMNHYSVVLNESIQQSALYQVGQWLQMQVMEYGTVCRSGSGEFIVILRNTDEHHAEVIGNQILQRFQRSWICRHTSVNISAQIWLTSVPDRITTKHQLRSFVNSSYDKEVSSDQILTEKELKSGQRRLDVEHAIHDALECHTFEVYYQPIYDTQTGHIHSAEALVRLRDPRIGFIPPDEFIPIAEENGSIIQIGEMVFEQVCRFLAEERPERYGLDFVEVNLSTVQCMNPLIVERLKSIAGLYNVPTSRINLEITETAVIDSEKTMQRVMRELEEAGFGFSLDDFGTGNSNYSYILKYPFQIIKIDKSFLWEAKKSEGNQIIFDHMVSLVKALGRQIVCEGVETIEQRDELTEKGVEYLQGYYYSKPIPREEFMFYLRNFDL